MTSRLRSVDGQTIAKPRLDLGWAIVAALFTVEFAIFGVTLYAFVVISAPLAGSFGWSAAQAGSLVSAMWLAAPLALFGAPLIERLGAWRMVVIGLCLQAAAVCAMVTIGSFPQLYLLRIVMGVGKVMAVSALPIILARWFSTRFATAIAIVWAGSSAGGIVLSPVAQAVSSRVGWKTSALVFGGVLGLVAATMAVIGRKARTPPDLVVVSERGPRPGAPKRWASAVPPSERPLAGLMFLAVVGAGVGAIAIISLTPRLVEAAGYSPVVSAAVLAVTAAAGMVGSASIGWLIDRFNLSASSIGVSVVAYVGLAVLGLLGRVHNLALGVLGAFCLGYVVGAIDVVWINLTKRRFGAAAFATTYGGWYFALQVGYAVGGGLGGWAFQQFGSDGFLAFVALIYVPAAVLGTWRPPDPSRP